jgi:GntR family transcriptional regulator
MRGDKQMAGPSLSQQIANDIGRSIAAGELPPGGVIPSERELRERYQTTKSTVNRAISLLQAEGLVRTESGRGVFVQEIPKVKRVRRIPARGSGSGSSFAEEMTKAGLSPETKLVQAEVIHPPVTIAKRLDITDSEQVLIRKRHMFANGRPVQLASSYIPLSIAGSLDLAFPDTGPSGIYERLASRGYRVVRFVEEVEARQPTNEEADFLRVSKFLYVLEVSRRACDPSGRALEVTINVLPSNLWQLSYEWEA